MLIVESQSLDVYRNLAIEEYLMDRVGDQGPILFLWRSDCAVVIGKNQNPWRECRLDRMRMESVPLARRISGGGTVYHDEGNLNYCVIVDRLAYRKDQAYDMVISALAPFGIHGERTGKTNLSVAGRKFSGNAFCFRRGWALHHGTLLLNTRLDRLQRYLGSMVDRIETRAIASVPAEIANLGLGVEEVSQSLIERFRALYGGDEADDRTDSSLDEDALRSLLERQVSHDWIYGATPQFSVELGHTTVEVEHGRVVSAAGEASSWIGRPFTDFYLSTMSQIDGVPRVD